MVLRGQVIGNPDISGTFPANVSVEQISVATGRQLTVLYQRHLGDTSEVSGPMANPLEMSADATGRNLILNGGICGQIPLGGYCLGVEAGVVERLVEQGGVGVSLAQQPGMLSPAAQPDRHRAGSWIGGVPGQYRVEQLRGGVGLDRQHQFWLGAGRALRSPSGRVHGVQCHPGLFEEHGPSRGQRDMMGAALQQGDAELGFEFADRP